MSQPLFEALRTSLAGRPLPLLVDDGGRICPGASLWTAARSWAAWLEGLGLGPGDRVAASLPNGRLYVVLLLACLRARITFCPLPTRLDPDERQARLTNLDPALILTTGSEDPGALALDPTAIDPPPHAKRRQSGRNSAGLAVILWSSGTAGQPRAIGLSEANLAAQALSHGPLLNFDGDSRIVSYLSWGHCFGFGVELLPALLANTEIVCVPDGGRDPQQLLDMARQVLPTHLFTVPKVLETLLDLPDSAAAFAGLRGGVVGGADLHPALAERLTARAWPLRQGYGQTECSPGITLGGPGDFRPGLLGRPVGCELRRTANGELWVRGPNVHAACWHGTPPRRDGDWLATGDLAQADPTGDWFWQGRTDACFKLANGHMVNAQAIEQQILAAIPDAVAVLAVGSGQSRVTPLVRLRPLASLPPGALPLAPWVDAPVVMPERFWQRCEGPTGKLSRPLAERTWREMTAGESTGLPIGLGVDLTAAAMIDGGTAGLAVSPDSWPAVGAAAEFLAAWVAAGKPCYGVTTGFGPLVAYDVDPMAAGHGLGLIRHLCAGFGPPAPPAIVRAMAISRAHTLAKGYAGISPETLRRWAAFAPEAGSLTVPRYGSVGASGDLIPMAHAVSGWLQRIGLTELPARDALALVNGTALTTALACAAVATGERLLRWSLRATAEVFAALGCPDAHLQPRIHALRGHGGQIATAAGIADQVARLAGPPRNRPLQEPYSLRCAPAVLGSLADALTTLATAAETELNGISDNPIVDVASAAVWHGGNFHAQQLGARLDLVLGAVVQAGNLAERQLALILEPVTNGGLPPLLAGRPGAQSGFAGAQLAATALVAQMRASCMPQSSQSLPTNLHNQDLVPFSVGSGWTLWDRLADWARLLATLLLAASQAAHAHDHPRADAFTAEQVLQLGRFSADQALAEPIDSLTASLLATG